MKKFFLFGALCVGLLNSCISKSTTQDMTIREIVDQKYEPGSVFIGATTGHRKLYTQDAELLSREFSYITPDNDFKQTQIHPDPTTWDWAISDDWVKIAERDNQLIRLHGPISPQCSDWAMHDSRTADQLSRNLHEFMGALCRRYDGHPNIPWIDEVNEVVAMQGGWNQARKGNSRGYECPWLKIGLKSDLPAKYKALHEHGGMPIFVLQAFEVATQNTNHLKLIINQHGPMEDFVWDKIKEMVLYLRESGYRVDGIAWQSHIQYFKDQEWSLGSRNIHYLGELIDWAHVNELDFHITENNIHDYVKEGEDLSEAYAEVFHNILYTVLERRGNGLVTWSLWNMPDQPHFRLKDCTLMGLWDEDYQPHPAYFKIKNLLSNPPKAIKRGGDQ